MTTGSRGLRGLDTFSGFSVDDLATAKSFYVDVLGLEVTEESAWSLRLVAGAHQVFVYAKGPAHAPAAYTVLNFKTPDVDGTVAELAARGVSFLRYDGLEQDEHGIARDAGPTIAWFTDPAGNVFSVLAAD